MKPTSIAPFAKDDHNPAVPTAPLLVPKDKRPTMQYRALLEAAPDAIVIVNPSGAIVFVNAQTERLFGYRRNELIGQPAEMLVAEPFRSQHSDQHSRLLSDSAARPTVAGLELFGLRKDRSEFPAEIRLSPTETTRGTLVCSAIRDISERTRTEEDLRRLASIVTCSDDAIFGKTLEGIITSWNAGAERIYGYSAKEAIGESVAMLVSRRDEIPEILERLKRGEIIDHFETVHIRRDGKEFHIEITASPIRDSMDRIVGASTIGRDISARKASEKHLLEMDAMLLQAQKMEAVGQLAGGVAHDFNNLLGVILGYAELLLERPGLTLPHRKDVEEIQKAGERAALLTRQLLAFSRKQVLQPKVIDLNALIAATTKLLQRLIGEHIELLVVRSSEVCRIKADPGQIEQIVMNLALNARDAMPAGGTLTIEISTVELDEKYAALHAPLQPGPYVILTVSDTGHGMDAATMDHIFDPFFTTKPFGKGSGLGLTIVYGIAKQGGGSVLVASTPGIGTTFHIYLPRVDQLPEHETVMGDVEQIQRGTSTVMIVEDDAALLQVTRRSLDEIGYTILSARNPAEAMQISLQHPGPIHLMVTDVVMPGISGAELAARLSASRPEMKVLYVSGYTDDAIVHHGVLEHGLAFLQKPFSPKALARKVSEMLLPAPTANSPALP